MSGAKEIRGKIGSVKNTQKITKAMEMVAASKMRKAQDRADATVPYAEKIRRAIGHLAKANPDGSHPLMTQRDLKRVGVIVVSSDRGLCGGLNINLFRSLLKDIQQWQDQGLEVEVAVIGRKAAGFFRGLKLDITAEFTDYGDKPTLDQMIGTVQVMLKRFTDGEIDQLHLIGNEFINTMTQKPRLQQLLPLVVVDEEEMPEHWDYIYEPDVGELLDLFIMRYIESQVFRTVVENVACEMSARMVAMKSSSDNAGKIIDELELAYNKARQAAITQELSEIIAGAAAV